MANWETQGLNLLFAKIRNTMPPTPRPACPTMNTLDLVTLIRRPTVFRRAQKV